jgi:hypothetical protein
MQIHVLSGDSLIKPFQKTNIEGEFIVCRECLIDGDLQAKGLDDFWRVREDYLSNSFDKPANFYQEKVKGEFDKLLENADGNEINLWFEYELFCQVNLWFCLWLLKDKSADIYIVYPYLTDKKDIWKGFGFLNEDELNESFEQRIKLSFKDITLGVNLWQAFQNKDWSMLDGLGDSDSKAFPTLKEVCTAACEIETRPEETLRQIMDNGETEFGKVFQEFNKTEDIYGFGDLQVKKIYDHLRK